MTKENETVEVAEVAEEATAEVKKPFAEMTEAEKLELPDEELIKHLGGDDNETNEEVQEDGREEEVVEEEEKEELTDDEEFDRMAKLSSEDFAKEPHHKKGLYHAMKRERAQRQDLQRELEKEREIRQAQVELMGKMREKKEPQQQFTSETEKVKSIINEKAQKYEEEYGDEYRLTWQDVKALEQASVIDGERHAKQRQAEEQESQHKAIRSTVEQRTTHFRQQLIDNGYDDFDYVFKNYIEPVINPNIAHDKEDAAENASKIVRKMLKGENGLEYAYKHLARMTPEGEKYFREKELKQNNKKLAEEATKTTTKTSAHVQTKATKGKTLVTIKKLNDNFDYWESKLSDEQFNKVAAGEEVYV